MGFSTSNPLHPIDGLVLNGVDQYVLLDIENADLIGNLTVAFRATQLSAQANYERVFEFDNGCASNSIFADVYTDMRGSWQVYGGHSELANNFWELNVMHTYAFVSDGTMYRDGVLMNNAHVQRRGIPDAARSHFFLGASSCPSIHKWHASVKWFGIWDVALTAQQISSLSMQPVLDPIWFMRFGN